MKFTVAKNAVLPADEAARTYLRDLAIGQEVDLREVNHASHKRFHLMLDRLAARPETPKVNLRNFLAIVTGHIDIGRMPGGAPVIVPRSISDMRAAEFEVFWEEVCEFVLTHMLPPPGADVDADDIARMAEPSAAATRVE